MPHLIKKLAVDSIVQMIKANNIPHRMIPELIRNVEMGLKIFKQISQRNFLTRCCHFNICPSEIRSLASRLTSNRSQVYDPKYEVTIMKRRINYINIDIFDFRRIAFRSDKYNTDIEAVKCQ